ncbi:MAG: alpha/beta fold hydrolase, partial [Planctomycetota bacterium]
MSQIRFQGHAGELAARFDRAESAIGTALFAHCFTCSKDIAAARRIAEGLNQRGVSVLRFDFTGLGHSDGEFGNTNFSSNIADLLAAAAWLRENAQPPALLVGHSLGGAAVLSGAFDIPECGAVATIGAPSDPGHVAHLFAEQRAEIEASGRATVT